MFDWIQSDNNNNNSKLEGAVRALTEHSPVVEVHVAALRARLDGIQQVVWAQEAGRPHHVQHLRQRHERQPHRCHHLLRFTPLLVLPAPAAQGLEDLLLTGSE